jgi:hypothetical protein
VFLKKCREERLARSVALPIRSSWANVLAVHKQEKRDKTFTGNGGVERGRGDFFDLYAPRGQNVCRVLSPTLSAPRHKYPLTESRGLTVSERMVGAKSRLHLLTFDVILSSAAWQASLSL